MRPKLSTIVKNIKLVKLVNGRYAIRKGWILYKYLNPVADEWFDRPYTDTCTSENIDAIATYFDFRFMNTGKEIELERYSDDA